MWQAQSYICFWPANWLYSMASLDDEAAGQQSETVEPAPTENDARTGNIITVTIGATVPTGFEHTAAEEVKEKIGVDVHVSKDRGRIYFPVTTDKLFQVKKLILQVLFTFWGVMLNPHQHLEVWITQIYFLYNRNRDLFSHRSIFWGLWITCLLWLTAMIITVLKNQR